MQQAAGQVRCLNCSHVFYAPDQLLKGFYGKHASSQTQEESGLLFMPDNDSDRQAQIQPSSVASETAETVSERRETREAPAPTQPGEVHGDADAPQADVEPEQPEPLSARPGGDSLSADARGRRHRQPVTLKSEKPRRGGLLVWLGMMVVLFSLVATLLTAMFDVWSRHPLVRGVYTYACDLIDCALPRDMTPVLMEVGAAGQTQLDPGVYRIRGAVLNKAYYPQPLPVIRLEFIDLQNKVHASRNFPPDIYAGEAPRLPPNKSRPFTIEVELADPVQFRLVPRFVLVSY